CAWSAPYPILARTAARRLRRAPPRTSRAARCPRGRGCPSRYARAPKISDLLEPLPFSLGAPRSLLHQLADLYHACDGWQRHFAGRCGGFSLEGACRSPYEEPATPAP